MRSSTRINKVQCRSCLRQRVEDIPVLAAGVVARASRETGREARLSAEAIKELQGYSWPGNVRELHNVLERAILLASSDVIGPADLLFRQSSRSDPNYESMTLEELEAAHNGTLHKES